jgi:hypothetical protein
MELFTGICVLIAIYLVIGVVLVVRNNKGIEIYWKESVPDILLWAPRLISTIFDRE